MYKCMKTQTGDAQWHKTNNPMKAESRDAQYSNKLTNENSIFLTSYINIFHDYSYMNDIYEDCDNFC